MPKVYSDRIVFDRDDWEAGLLAHRDTNLPSREPSGLMIGRKTDPFRRPGYLVPERNPDTVSNSSEILGGVSGGVSIDSGIALLLASEGEHAAEVHKLTCSTNTVSSGGGWPHTISAHAGHANPRGIGQDIINYRHNIGGTLRTSTFYGWYDNTDFDVGTYGSINSGASPAWNDDFMSTVPATPLAGADLTDGQGEPHPMVVGADGELYIGSGRYIHSYDGTTGANGTFNSQVLDLAPGWVARKMLATERYLIIFADRAPAAGIDPWDCRSEARVFWWDYVSPSFEFSEDLHDNYVASAAVWKGDFIAYTFGRTDYAGNRGRLRKRGSGAWDITAAIDDYGSMNCMETTPDRLYVQGGQGFLYALGDPTGKRGDDVLMHIAAAVQTGRGFVRNFYLNELMFSGGTASLERLKSNYAAGMFAKTNFAFPKLRRNMEAKMQYVRIKFAKAATPGRACVVQLLTDGGGDTTSIFASGTVAAGSIVRDYTKDASDGNLPRFSDVALQVTSSSGYDAADETDCPAIESVEVFYTQEKIMNKQ